MSWTQSRIFTSFVNSVLLKQGTAPTGYTSLTADTLKAALYNNTTTPDPDAAVASTGYNTGQWVTANEVSTSSDWVAGGRALTSVSVFQASGVNGLQAATISGTTSITLAASFGCLIYDNSITGGTVAKQGVAFAYFGGAKSVTGGTFSIAWAPSGVLSFTN